MITIQYCPELSVYRLSDGHRERVITEADLAEGGHYAPCREAFDKAKAAVVEGRAVCGICFD